MIISEREKEVLDKISLGLSTKEIAVQLYLSTHTVITHRRHLLKKMDAKNSAVLIRKGFEAGLLLMRTNQ